MPALPVVPNVLRVTLKMSYGADTSVVNGFFMQWSGTTPTNSNLNTLASAIATAWATDIAPLCQANVTLVEVDVTDLTSASGAVGVWTGSHLGTRTGSAPPAGTCVLLAYKIARRYRGGHPRTYLPAGVQADISTPQTWNPTFVTSCVNAWASFISAIEAAPWSGGTISGQVSVSFYHGFNNVTYPSGRTYPRSTTRGTALVDVIIGISGRVAFASQRRRN